MAERLQWAAADMFTGASEVPVQASLNTTALIPAYGFSDSATNSLYVAFQAPSGLTGALTLAGTLRMASGNTGNVRLAAAIMAVTAGDAVDLASALDFATDNEVNVAVPGTAGRVGTWSITLTNTDGIAAGDWVLLRFRRIGGDATNDTAAGLMYPLTFVFSDAA